MEAIITSKILITLLGWGAWNVFLFNIEKDKADEANLFFSFSNYVQKQWDNWLASLFIVPILLWIGSQEMDIHIFGDTGPLKWQDIYLLGSGFFYEAVIFSYKKWKEKR